MLLASLRRAPLLVLCVYSLAPPALPQQPAQTSPDIRVSVDRVNVGVVVTDSRGQFVGGLQRGDFHLFDNGIEQPITDFLSIDEPAQILLLIEAGPAVYLLEGGHLLAVHALLDGLSPGDRVAIARYNEAPEPILNFTPDKRAAAGALDELHFNLGFAQLNLASSLITALDWLARVPGKKTIVLLSTGVDTSPSGAGQNLLARLKTTDVRILAISLGRELRNAKPTDSKHRKKDQATPGKTQAAEGFAQADEELREIAEANGGRAYFPRTARDFAGVFTEIAQLVRHEYNLGFAPPAHDAKVHLIEVRIDGLSGDGLSGAAPAPSTSNPPSAALYRVDHRQAYLAPPPEHP